MRLPFLAIGLGTVIWMLGAFIPAPLLAQQGAWVQQTPMPTARKNLAACAIDQHIYVLGGVLDESDPGLATNERYDTATDTWSVSTPMPTARASLTAATVDGVCYAIGGRTANGGEVLRTVESFDPATGQWTTRADMPTARFLPASAVMDGKIYVAGGATPGGASGIRVTGVFQVYDPATDSWTMLPNVPTERSGAAAGAVGGKVYVMGGTERPGAHDFALVEVYGIESNTWAVGDAMPVARNWLTSAVAGEKIYAIGGSRIEDASNLVNFYDPATSMWSAAPSLNGPRIRLAAAVVGNRIFSIGGANAVFEGNGLNTVEALTVEVAPGFQITAGLNGNWWNGPARSGEGAQVEVADGGNGSLVFVATFYSYDPMGNQIFLVAVGPVSGDTAEVEVFITDGGIWGDDFDPMLINETPWGAGIFVASDCETIHMALMPNAEYQALGYTDLMYDMVRLTTPAIDCP
jgi:N-acetylneuraminic acid mutarotase